MKLVFRVSDALVTLEPVASAVSRVPGLMN